MQYYYNLGWYSGTHDLVTIKMQGGFEAFSGRATEAWEHQFVINTARIKIGDITIPACEAIGQTLEEACSKILKLVKGNE